MESFIYKLLLLILTSSFITCELHAQTNYKIHSSILDTLYKPIPGAEVILLLDKDSVKTITDSLGEFHFNNLTGNSFSIMVMHLGFKSVGFSSSFPKDQSTIMLAPIMLKQSTDSLKEIVIREKPIPVTLKKDTVEYNALAYHVSKNDLLGDLLKQLPGLSVSADGTVTINGKVIGTLRVNGKDFFSGNLSEFLNQLPADIISKLQVIDDYGNEANFSGIKTGESHKLLNLVIKPGMSFGTFGNLSSNVATNNQAGIAANGNLWQNSKQLSLGTKLNVGKSDYGINRTNGINALFRNTLTKILTINTSYGLDFLNSRTKTLSYNEVASNIGKDNTNTTLESQRRSRSQIASIGLDYRPNEKNYLTINTSVNSGADHSADNSTSLKTGLLNQVLLSDVSTGIERMNVSNNLALGHRFNASGRVITFSINYSHNTLKNDQSLADHITYQESVARPDSLSNRKIDNLVKSNLLNSTITYSEPVLKNLFADISYNLNINKQTSDFVTHVDDNQLGSIVVDSLSNFYKYSLITQNTRLSLRYVSEKFNAGLGVTTIKNSTDDYSPDVQNLSKTVTQNFSPVINFSYLPSNNTSMSLNYIGTTVTPTPEQLQPVTDTRDIQNTVIGNPNLKTPFTHSITGNYHHVSAQGTNLDVNLGLSLTQNQICINTIFINDQSNGLKRESRYVNVSGNYTMMGNYNYSFPLIEVKGIKYNLNLNGNAQYGKSNLLSNSQPFPNTNIVFSQSASMQIFIDKVAITGTTIYNYSANTFSTESESDYHTQSYQFDLEGGMDLFRKSRVTISVDDKIQNGFQMLPYKSPLTINAGLEQHLFKNAASIVFQVYDLLNKGNNLTISNGGNSIAENRSIYTSRYFKIGFVWQLRHFGKRQS
jgi:hypothetical protein